MTALLRPKPRRRKMRRATVLGLLVLCLVATSASGLMYHLATDQLAPDHRVSSEYDTVEPSDPATAGTPTTSEPGDGGGVTDPETADGSENTDSSESTATEPNTGNQPGQTRRDNTQPQPAPAPPADGTDPNQQQSAAPTPEHQSSQTETPEVIGTPFGATDSPPSGPPPDEECTEVAGGSIVCGTTPTETPSNKPTPSDDPTNPPVQPTEDPPGPPS